MRSKLAIVDGRIPCDMLMALRSRGFLTVALPPCPTLSEPVSSHPDMLIARVGTELVTTADYCEIAGAEISEIFDTLRSRFHFTSDTHGRDYPSDVIFNSLVMGDKLFARVDSLSRYLVRLAESAGLRLVNVAQGYPACTVLKLSDEAAITADRGMAEALRAKGIRVYLIENGGISLPPYEFGFIGGASGVFGGAVYFLGDASRHPSWEIISDAVEKEGLRAVMLGRCELLDLGGIIFAESNIDKDNADGNE